MLLGFIIGAAIIHYSKKPKIKVLVKSVDSTPASVKAIFFEVTLLSNSITGVNCTV